MRRTTLRIELLKLAIKEMQEQADASLRAFNLLPEHMTHSRAILQDECELAVSLRNELQEQLKRAEEEFKNYENK